jgi:Flp pilus assembly pilin Flp
VPARLDGVAPPSHRRAVIPSPSEDPPPPSRRGLAELVLLVGFLALAAAGVVAVFGDELRQAFGAPPAAATSARGPARAP